MDKLLEKVGSFGKFQKLILIIIGTSATLSGLTVFMSVFNNAIPAVLCTNKQTSFKANETFLNNVCQVLENITKSKETSQETPYECSFDTSRTLFSVNAFNFNFSENFEFHLNNFFKNTTERL